MNICWPRTFRCPKCELRELFEEGGLPGKAPIDKQICVGWKEVTTVEAITALGSTAIINLSTQCIHNGSTVARDLHDQVM